MIHFLSALFFPSLFYSEMVFFDNKTSGQKIPHLKKSQFGRRGSRTLFDMAGFDYKLLPWK
jgi:hypothetical protein